MKTARNISWEIRGRRLVDGTLVDQHVATGFGPDAASAIRWARRHQPANTSAFHDADLRAIPDPLGPDFPILPVASPLLASLVVLACVCVSAIGGQPISSAPEVFHDELVGLSADLPSTGSTRGPGKFFDRDTVVALFVFGCSIGALIWAGMQLDRKDDAESAKAIQDITRTYDL